MAVVQISRIQQRRGRKDSATGFPQLASGEIGWAIDTQELYIGNGSVSEGAPYVGNTQILTEHVNILDFAEAYQYQRNNYIIKTGPTDLQPVQRTLQQRFDERVDIKSFIYEKSVERGDDVTEDIQRAIDQLYLNVANRNPDTRVILYFGPGEYFISEELKIPPYCHIMGAGIDSTIIHLTGTGSYGSLMRMVDGVSTPGVYTPFESMSYTESRPRFITIEKLTLQTDHSDTIVLLDNTDSSIFNQVKFLGSWVNGIQPKGTSPIDVEMQTGIYARGTSGIHRSENVQFLSCIFNKTGFGFFSDTDHNDISFQNCQFYQLYDGIQSGDIDNSVFGAVNTKVDSCYFDLIDRYGIYIKIGFGNTSSNNKFMLVGNNNEGHASATYPIIRYDTPNNQSSNDFFERNDKLRDQTNFGLIPFYSNIRTSGLVIDPTSFTRPLETTPSVPIEFFRFPIHESSIYIIEYIIHKNSGGSSVRTGTIHITANLYTNKYHLEDNYTYSGSTTVENIEFSSALQDYDGDGYKETLVLKLWNPTGNGVGVMSYSYRALAKGT